VLRTGRAEPSTQNNAPATNAVIVTTGTDGTNAPPTRPAVTSTTVRWIPRQNPMSPPRPSTTTTRSGRAVVPTLRGLNV
jgi:hypothetical protein